MVHPSCQHWRRTHYEESGERSRGPSNLDVIYMERLGAHPNKDMATEEAIPDVTLIPPRTLIIEECWKVLCKQ